MSTNGHEANIDHSWKLGETVGFVYYHQSLIRAQIDPFDSNSPTVEQLEQQVIEKIVNEHSSTRYIYPGAVMEGLRYAIAEYRADPEGFIERHSI